VRSDELHGNNGPALPVDLDPEVARRQVADGFTFPVDHLGIDQDQFCSRTKSARRLVRRD
jgi:hypothetical protein